MASTSLPDDSTSGIERKGNPVTATKSQAFLDEASATGAQLSKQGLPVQKRRRATQACDGCCQKKTKCDGKLPCTYCMAHGRTCTYYRPSRRRRHPSPRYVEALEHRLQRVNRLLQVIAPNLNLDDPSLDTTTPEHLMATLQTKVSNSQLATSRLAKEVLADNDLLEITMDRSGSLELDAQGYWEYYGDSSEHAFVSGLQKRLGSLIISPLQVASSSSANVSAHGDVQPQSDLRHGSAFPAPHHLPAKEISVMLCRNALDTACTLMRFVHEPSFFDMINRVYDTPVGEHSEEERSFLPLLYLVLAVGCIFSNDLDTSTTTAGYQKAISHGFQYFRTGRQLLNITGCRDLTSLQAVCFMILFLQFSAELSTCYSYIGIAVRSALRLGLHRSLVTHFDIIERELRKRVFWVIWRMDTQVSTALGMPLLINEDDIDQDLPLLLDDIYVSPKGTPPLSFTNTCLMAGVNAHIALVKILAKAVKCIYPVGNAKPSLATAQEFEENHSKIQEIEKNLQDWVKALPAALRPEEDAPKEIDRIRLLLRIEYAHVQLIMYRPFLHYFALGSQPQDVQKRLSTYATACVRVSRNIVHIATHMFTNGFVDGPYWSLICSTYYAALSLILLFVENNHLSHPEKSILTDALRGKSILMKLAKKSPAAEHCVQSLNSFFQDLFEELRRQKSTSVSSNLKPPSSASVPVNPLGTTNPSQPILGVQQSSSGTAISQTLKRAPFSGSAVKSSGYREEEN